MFLAALTPDGPFGRFADALLLAELPGLSEPDRAQTVQFVCHRATQLPSPLRLGVIGLSILLASLHRLVDPRRVDDFFRSTTLPLIGELARMVRSLGFAFVWETWPDSDPDGQRSTTEASP